LSTQRTSAANTCKQVAQQATEFLENRLPSVANIDIWRHLEACADCRTYIEQLALVRDSLHRLPEPEMPDETREKLLQRLGRMARSNNS
jgi:predicted anti-sigma-YlaC factor YlaD